MIKLSEYCPLHPVSKQIDFPSKRPYPQKKLLEPTKRKVKLSEREKALTLAAGFPCRDGAILCADTEITRAGILKIPGEKILTYKCDNVSLAVTGAGDWSYVEMTFQKISDKLGQIENPDLTPNEVQEVIEQTLLRVYESFVAVDPESAKFSIIAATRTDNDELGLLASHESPAIARFHGFQCAGGGQILASYLADIFYNASISINKGVFLAAYVLGLAKKYVSGVGGRSDILVITPNGEMKLQRPDFVKDLEATFENFDTILQPILFSVPDIHMPEEEFDQEIVTFNRKIRELRKKLQDGHYLDFLDDD